MTTNLDPKIDVNPVDANRFDTTEEILKSFQGNSKAIDRTKKAFEVAAASARKNGQPLNTLHLLAALMRDFSALAVNEVADQKKVSMKDLIQRCEVAARVADAATAEE